MMNFHMSRDALVEIHPEGFDRIREPFIGEVGILGDAMISAVATEVHAACVYGDALQHSYVEAAWAFMTLRIARHVGWQGSVSDTRRRELLRSPLSDALDFIEAHALDGDIRISELARITGLSAVQFTRRFEAATGETPLQHVLGRRLDRARRRLVSDDATIGTIAHEVGFASHARFSEAFRRRFGSSPSDFREAMYGTLQRKEIGPDR